MAKRPGLARRGRPRIMRDEDAATMVEYALLITLVALACVAAATALGHSVPAYLQSAINGLS